MQEHNNNKSQRGMQGRVVRAIGDVNTVRLGTALACAASVWATSGWATSGWAAPNVRPAAAGQVAPIQSTTATAYQVDGRKAPGDPLDAGAVAAGSICDIEDPANCQAANGAYILVNDRALFALGQGRWADDFQAANAGPLSRICAWPAFFNPEVPEECAAPGETPPDDFQMRLYADAGGLPGAEIGAVQTLDVFAKERVGTTRIWLYTFDVPVPPELEADQCYWLEYNGLGEGFGGCTVYSTTSLDGNDYAVYDDDGIYGPEDVRTMIGDPPGPVDMAFCVENGLGGEGCGFFTGACCLPPPAPCQDDQTVVECESQGGVYYPGQTCDQVTCAACEASTCNEAVDLNGEGWNLTDTGTFSRDFDTSFCDNIPRNSACDINQGDTGQNGTTPIGNATWFAYTMGADECGTLTVSTCDPNNYDGAMAAWLGVCPASKTDPTACGDDTCGVGGGMPVISLDVVEGQTVIVKLGGWQGETGSGTMVWTLDAVDCSGVETLARPLADDRLYDNDSQAACAGDNDCPNTSVCRDGFCYVPIQRFLSIRPNPANAGALYTYRMSVDAGVAGFVPVGFAGSPITHGTPANPFVYVDNVDAGEADYRDWHGHAALEGNGYLEITGCEVAPDHNYIVQAIAQGLDTGNEANYSPPLELPTAQWGDVTGGGMPPSPPNGSSNLVDVFACVASFQDADAGLPFRCDMEPINMPNGVVSLADVFVAVLGWGGDYPGPDPQDCP